MLHGVKKHIGPVKHSGSPSCAMLGVGGIVTGRAF